MEKIEYCLNLCHSDEGRIFLIKRSLVPRNDNPTRWYKFKIFSKILTSFIFMVLIFSCQKAYNSSQPEILTAQYEIRTHSEFERGYEIFMVIDKMPKTFSIKGIVLKDKLFDKVHYTDMSDNEIFIEQYFPVQSRMIQNFEAPATDNRPDGIIFEVEGKEYFYEIKFKLK